MPLWLDMLRTPMAAPETTMLRFMRRAWFSLCVVLAGAVTLLDPLQVRLGRGAPATIGVLLLATVATTILYWRAKHRADSAYLDELGESE